MDTATAVAALGALAQEARLAIFRRLVVAGPVGLPAGELARALGIAPPNLTFHLQQLVAAGLVRSQRAGRRVFYALEAGAMRRLMAFLAEDCCQGNPELCLPASGQETCCPPRRTASNKRPPLRSRAQR